MSEANLTVAIRKMTATDLEQVHKLEKMCFSTPWPLKTFRFELEGNEASSQWVAVQQTADGGEEVIGVIVCWLLVDEVHVANLSVHPAHRRNKIASGLLCTALAALIPQGAVSATLEVRAGNHGANRLYSRFGFQVMGRRPGYYKDNGEDAIILTLHQLDEDHLNIIGCQKFSN